MNTVKKQIRAKDLAGAEVALRRAAKRAKTIAQQTDTPLIVYEEGHVVKKLLDKGSKKA
ncbi:MAG: hypothetical protein HZA15_03730 [Nitrospirae bacterium]|nr:hypothetical protein [Nitrospirota bacterium]